ncbi:hypothetical protein NBO_54g0003 [Nosema bombycis CQ1]|uniref:Ubiquitin-like domain-containing protein n=1 Tax=Nosema bombycis (strain CQ1 / CVCC 102059) TaxID=578461 RepID=R0KUH4_NOSB1|nr:hypothetical protein NBO_54g0003 [Nosema bombycis CQ1]|eukprot:EOB13857.1 hypothetical protein NBO_54g0003 [Nosema bombycis CQ1]
MRKVVLNSRDGKFKFEKEFTEGKTVKDVKDYLSEHIKIVFDEVKKESINVFYNENILVDTIVLSNFESLELSLVFEYVQGTLTNNGDEVSSNSIVQKISVRVKENGSKIYVDPNDLITKDNKTYLIKKRTKILNVKFILEVIKNFRLTREDIVKFIVFSFLLFTNNSEVLFILGSIFLLQMASSALIKYKKNFTKNMEHINRTVLMFVVSLFMIDHNRV